MSWLQKRPQVNLPVNYFTVGQNSTILIVGLGNPEAKYDDTRHNIGFACVDAFVKKHDEMSPWVIKKDLKCMMSEGRIGDSKVIVTKPTTYMNLSGESVQATFGFYKLQLNHVLVVHDELDIKFGQIRTRYGGSPAGHNGIKSISNMIGEDYGRIRIGIGPKIPEAIDSADFVLQRFNEKELKQMENLKRETVAILSEFIYNKNLTQETRTFIV